MTGKAVPPAERGAGQDGADEIRYEGNALPWWVCLIWVGFLGWAAWYIVVNFVPDLLSWLR